MQELTYPKEIKYYFACCHVSSFNRKSDVSDENLASENFEMGKQRSINSNKTKQKKKKKKLSASGDERS